MRTANPMPSASNASCQAHELALHPQAPRHRGAMLHEQRHRLDVAQEERAARGALDRETRHALEPYPREQLLPYGIGHFRRLDRRRGLET